MIFSRYSLRGTPPIISIKRKNESDPRGEQKPFSGLWYSIPANVASASFLKVGILFYFEAFGVSPFLADSAKNTRI